MGAWIEISAPFSTFLDNAVASLVGAWIEIEIKAYIRSFEQVASLVGAWIEIFVERVFHKVCECRFPCGSVD